MSTWEQLYANWLEKLDALSQESEKHDFSPAGEAAYDAAYADAKQAYALLHAEDVRRIDAQLKAVQE